MLDDNAYPIIVEALHDWADCLRKERLRRQQARVAPIQTEVISRMEQRLNKMMDEMKCLQKDLAELKGTTHFNEVE